ncbi:storkhead-box protein 1-like [Manacus candei]|uniref:storkhead-box protein 1-like n=1 Tax=Manacus candei TaxID=415023 RepID=UPI002225CB2D|nr:storkhead-box protein 1-like [Manacus candei]
MPRRAERCLQIAPHSLAIVLDAAAGGRPGVGGGAGAGAGPAAELGRHRIGYEIFADFKRENMQHFWDRRATAAVAETFFLGWIDEQVLLVQGKEEHLEVLRQGWARRSLKPPSGFHIKCLGEWKRTGKCDHLPTVLNHKAHCLQLDPMSVAGHHCVCSPTLQATLSEFKVTVLGKAGMLN